MTISIVKIRCIAFVSTIIFSGAVSSAWQAQQGESPRYGFPPESRLESRYGQHGQADVTAHKHVSKGTHLKCIMVEQNPQHDRGVEAACLLRFEGGDKYTLYNSESMKSPGDAEVYLECAGGKPSRCTVGTW